MIPLPILKFIQLLLQLIEKLIEQKPMQPMPLTYSDRIYNKAFESLGKDITPNDEVPDSVACVHQLSSIVRSALEPDTSFPILDSTRALYEYLSNSFSWKPIDLPESGAILVYVTGTGNGSVPNGHTFICGKKTSEDGSIYLMSNTSSSGKWEVNYTLNGAQRYFASKGGMSAVFFKCV